MRGRKPTPTVLKLVAGQTRKDRLNDDEPQPGEGIPTCPSTDDEVRAVWDYTIDQLSRMRVVTMADRDLLATYCEAVVQHRRATEVISQRGIIVEGSHGGWVSNPAVKVQREAATQIRAFGTEFGLTPSSRTRIKVGAQKPSEAPEKGASRLLSG